MESEPLLQSQQAFLEDIEVKRPACRCAPFLLVAAAVAALLVSPLLAVLCLLLVLYWRCSTPSLAPPGTFIWPLGIDVRFSHLSWVRRGRLGAADIFAHCALFKRTAVCVGAEAMAQIEEKRRADKVWRSFPPAILKLFGRSSIYFDSLDEHHRRKAALMKVFDTANIDSYQSSIHQYLRVRLKQLASAGSFDVKEALRVWTSDLMILLLFGHGDGVHSWPGVKQKIDDCVNGMKWSVIFGSDRQTEKDFELLFSFIKRAVLPIREKWNEGQQQQSGKTLCVAERMVQIVSNKGDFAEELGAPDVIEREMLHFLLAGGVQVAVALTWAFYEVTRSQELRTRIREEVVAASLESSAPGDAVSKCDLLRCELLTSTTFEVRRFHPNRVSSANLSSRCPALALRTRSTKDDAGRLVEIPPQWEVLQSFVGTNRSTEDWAEADRFRPDRFQELGWDFEQPWRHSNQAQAYAYCPQGAGPMKDGFRCAGEYLTTKILSIFLAELSCHWTWEAGEAFIAAQGSSGAPPFDGETGMPKQSFVVSKLAAL
eukprot:TRINITY_DN23655_c0_g1_i1.p1 TRINITY_DN23655_c0_g1~~TRINITY_DN23655_c0_g1_i1.p1  ORF type:complete len:542 (+),score=77.87 TRINITY_DN23655_c0_g1_i1:65-1690(+)